MNANELIDALHTAARLKDVTRHCDTPGGRRESVAEHSWRLALLAMWLREDFPEADMDKVLRMCLIHDLGEAFTGDIPVFNKTEADEARERELLFAWVDSLPKGIGSEMQALYEEMLAMKSTEARIYKALDGMEALLAHNEAALSTWEPHEYELQRRYAVDRAAFSPILRELRQAILEETEKKIAEGK